LSKCTHCFCKSWRNDERASCGEHVAGQAHHFRKDGALSLGDLRVAVYCDHDQLHGPAGSLAGKGDIGQRNWVEQRAVWLGQRRISTGLRDGTAWFWMVYRPVWDEAGIYDFNCGLEFGGHGSRIGGEPARVYHG